MPTNWIVKQSTVPYSQGQLRWDTAYQFIVKLETIS